MSRSITLTLLLAVFLLSASDYAWASEYPQAHRVVGNKIVNESGEHVVYHGVNFTEDLKAISTIHFADGWLPKAFNTARQWGSTMVRINIVPAYYRRIGIAAYLDEIASYVELAKKHNIYIFLNWSSTMWALTGYGYDPDDYSTVATFTTPKELEDFWEAVAERFAGEKAFLGFELFNEPTGPEGGTWETAEYKDWDDWKLFCEGLFRRSNDTTPKGSLSLADPVLQLNFVQY